MERGTLLGRLTWQLGEVVATQLETARIKSITPAVLNWVGHMAGQHVDVRLTAEDGYQAERSYSIVPSHLDTSQHTSRPNASDRQEKDNGATRWQRGCRHPASHLPL